MECGGRQVPPGIRNMEEEEETNMRKLWTLSIPALEYNLDEALLKSPRDKETARSTSCKLFLQFLAHVRMRSMLLKRQAG